MKVLIWIVFEAIIPAVITTALGMAGFLLGGIPTILLFAAGFAVSRALCKEWDEYCYKKGKKKRVVTSISHAKFLEDIRIPFNELILKIEKQLNISLSQVRDDLIAASRSVVGLKFEEELLVLWKEGQEGNSEQVAKRLMLSSAQTLLKEIGDSSKAETLQSICNVLQDILPI